MRGLFPIKRTFRVLISSVPRRGGLLLVLGLCVVSGCAAPGASRENSFSQRLGWPGKNASSQESSRAEQDAQGVVSFRAPSRREQLKSDEPAATTGASRRQLAAIGDPAADTSPLRSGHSSDRSAMPPQQSLKSRPMEKSQQTASNSTATATDIVPAGHEESPESQPDQPAHTGQVVPAIALNIEPLPDEEPAVSPVTTANYRSDRDSHGNPVQLEVFEVIAPLTSTLAAADATEPPLWSDRPGAAAIPPASGRRATGPERGAANPVNRVQPISAQAAPTVPPSPWQAELEQLIARVERDLTDLKPGSTPAAQAEYRRRHVQLRLLSLMAQRPEQALTAIAGLEPAEQEYWQQLLWAMSNSLDAEQFPLPRDRAAQSIAPLNTALRRLREQADLSIKNMAFCEQISYFGNYQKFARDEFTPGQEVLLYAEIENFGTSQTADGEHRTLLRSVIEILGPDGEVRWPKRFPATEDRCRNPRRDYFHNYQFAIPDRLPLGPHTLKLTVVDDLSGKQASYSLNFLVK